MMALAALAVALSLGAGPGHAADSLTGFMQHGIAHGLARWRSRTLRDVRYDLTLDVTARDSATGSVTVRFSRSGNQDVILDYRGRRLGAISVNGAAFATTFAGDHLRIPARLLAPGDNSVVLPFVAEIAATGASIIRVHDPADQQEYLYTLLVPADANQLFPCFDQPDLKARVTLHLTVPAGWTALANGSIARADTTGDQVTDHFTETKPLPTYLIAFATGPWERVTSTVHGRTVHLFVRRSRAAEADADTLLALQQRALDWMERYFGRPFPFEKFDMVLAPAFPFGGMEHPGVVMYNEDRFIFRERPTLPRRLGRFSTILHETAHQWFGDLVTMRWFDDLWLKEGFATYMAAKALADLEPAAQAWKTFYLSNKPPAYGVDQTLGTTPLWQAMGNLDQAKSAYGAIVYNKAPSVLKQLNYLVGEPAFQRGVRAFLDAHAYANATWRDLLSAIGGDSLDAFGQSFVLRPGIAVVEARLTMHHGTIQRLELVQRPAQPGISGPAPWPMRTNLLFAPRDGSPVDLPVVLRDTVTDVAAARGRPAPSWIFPNAGDYGYFLTLLDTATVSALERGALRDVHDGLLRAMLWGALWDQVRDARLDPARFARLVLTELPFEQDEQIVPALLGRLGRTIGAYLPSDEWRATRAAAETVLWTVASDTARAFGVRRAALDAFISIAATPAGLARMKTLLRADSAAGAPLRDPTRWSVVNRLLVIADSGAPRALADQIARDTTADGHRRAFIAGAARPDSAVLADYFRRWFADTSLNEDWASGSLETFNALEHESLTLPYLLPALDSLPHIQQHRRIFFLGAWLASFLSGQTSLHARDVVRAYLRAHPALPLDLRQKVLQNADELERTVRIRARFAAPSLATTATPAQTPVAAGRLSPFLVHDSAYNRLRQLWVYTPPGFTAGAATTYPLIVAFDGAEYRDTMPLPQVLDTLLATHRSPAFIAVLIDDSTSGARIADLGNAHKMVRFLGQLIPWVRAHWPVVTDPHRVIVTGSSAGGLAAAYVAFERPDLFGNVWSQSGAFWRGAEASNEAPYEWLTAQVAAAPRKDVRFVLDVGALEDHPTLGGTGPNFLQAHRRFRDALLARGYDVTATEVPGGNHAPQWWRQRLPFGIATIAATWE